MSYSELLVALGGATMVIGGIKMIFGSGKVVGVVERLDKKFDDHQLENKLDKEELRRELGDLHNRVGVLEYANGLTDRRHILRRTHDHLSPTGDGA